MSNKKILAWVIEVGVEPTCGHGKYASAKVGQQGARFLLVVVVVAVAVATVCASGAKIVCGAKTSGSFWARKCFLNRSFRNAVT